MPWDEDEYKEWQHRYEDIEEEWDEDWSNEKRRDHFENLRLHNEHPGRLVSATTKAKYAGHNAKVLRAKSRLSRELKGREEAREEWGDDADDGHDQRIDDLRARDQLLKLGIAHAEGEYEYQAERMQDMDADLKRELERENDERWENNEHVEGDDHDERENEQEETSDMEIEDDSD